MSAARTVALLASLAASALAAAGCGGSTPKAQRHASAALGGPCTARALASLAGSTRIPAGAIATRRFVELDGNPACRFTAGRGALDVSVELDRNAQPYFMLEKEAVESTQNVVWHDEGASVTPVYLPGLGLEAYWFGAARRLMSTDGVTLISVVVVACPRADGSGETLARALSRRYLGPIRNTAR